MAEPAFDYEIFYLRVFQLAVRVVRRDGWQEADAEDAVQDAYMRASSRDALTGTSNPKSFFIAMCRKQATWNWWEQNREALRAGALLSVGVSLQAPQSTPLQRAEADAVLREILASPYRDTLYRFFVLGESIPEIAAATGLEKGKIGSRIYWGRARLIQAISTGQRVRSNGKKYLGDGRGLDEEKVRQIMALLDQDSARGAASRIARHFGVVPSLISQIRSGVIWSHVTGIPPAAKKKRTEKPRDWSEDYARRKARRSEQCGDAAVPTNAGQGRRGRTSQVRARITAVMVERGVADGSTMKRYAARDSAQSQPIDASMVLPPHAAREAARGPASDMARRSIWSLMIGRMRASRADQRLG